jgi:hypothetical protein
MTIIKPKPTLKVHDAKYNYNYKVLPSLTMACNIFNPWMAGWAMKKQLTTVRKLSNMYTTRVYNC